MDIMDVGADALYDHMRFQEPFWSLTVPRKWLLAKGFNSIDTSMIISFMIQTCHFSKVHSKGYEGKYMLGHPNAIKYSSFLRVYGKNNPIIEQMRKEKIQHKRFKELEKLLKKLVKKHQYRGINHHIYLKWRNDYSVGKQEARKFFRYAIKNGLLTLRISGWYTFGMTAAKAKEDINPIDAESIGNLPNANKGCHTGNELGWLQIAHGNLIQSQGIIDHS